MTKTKRLYTGPTLMAKGLSARLSEVGIVPIERNDHDSGIRSGFAISIPNQTMLFVREDEWETAAPILEEFLEDIEEE